MAEGKGLKIGVGVCIVIIVALAFINIASLGSIASLHTEKTKLEHEVADLQTSRSNLQQEIAGLEEDIANLEAPSLHLIDLWWGDNHPLFSDPYMNVRGYVINTGEETATNVVLTVTIYEGSVLLKTEDITLEDIYGEWYGKFDVDIYYSGDADSVVFGVSHG